MKSSKIIKMNSNSMLQFTEDKIHIKQKWYLGCWVLIVKSSLSAPWKKWNYIELNNAASIQFSSLKILPGSNFIVNRSRGNPPIECQSLTPVRKFMTMRNRCQEVFESQSTPFIHDGMLEFRRISSTFLGCWICSSENIPQNELPVALEPFKAI